METRAFKCSRRLRKHQQSFKSWTCRSQKTHYVQLCHLLRECKEFTKQYTQIHTHFSSPVSPWALKGCLKLIQRSLPRVEWRSVQVTRKSSCQQILKEFVFICGLCFIRIKHVLSLTLVLIDKHISRISQWNWSKECQLKLEEANQISQLSHRYFFRFKEEKDEKEHIWWLVYSLHSSTPVHTQLAHSLTLIPPPLMKSSCLMQTDTDDNLFLLACSCLWPNCAAPSRVH